jgi:hypothetical protein
MAGLVVQVVAALAVQVVAALVVQAVERARLRRYSLCRRESFQKKVRIERRKRK